MDAQGEREIPATRLTIGSIPLSFSNEEILKYVEKLSVKTRSRLMDERARDENGKLSHWKTGRRFIYIDVPATPLPRSLKMGNFNATLFHKEQKTVICSKCLSAGHHQSTCSAPVRCKQCLGEGHKAGASECELAAPMPPPSSSEEKKKQTTITSSFNPREPRQPAGGASTASQSARSRSLTPAQLTKRTRSPSAQRSPRSAGMKKNVRVNNTAPLKENANSNSDPGGERDYMDDDHSTLNTRAGRHLALLL